MLKLELILNRDGTWGIFLPKGETSEFEAKAIRRLVDHLTRLPRERQHKETKQ